MNCDKVRNSVILAAYGELPDEDAIGLELHMSHCPECMDEVKAMEQMAQLLAATPVVEPSPNLLTQSRMRLDEALDAMPQHGLLTRLRVNFFAWMGHLQSAPALATLLVGVGFLAGNFIHQYQDAHAPKTPGIVILSNQTGGGVASISGVTRTSNPDIVQVSYNRTVSESAEGSLDDPNIRRLLMLGTKAASDNGVRADAVALLAGECQAGHACRPGEEGTEGRDVLKALLVSLRYDKNAGVRMKALEGLQSYVSTDQRVRDGIAEALLHDSNASVRTKAIGILEPVQSDSSVRQVFRTLSTTDENPYIRTVSTRALQGAADIQ
jgi:hypothetical protein